MAKYEFPLPNKMTLTDGSVIERVVGFDSRSYLVRDRQGVATMHSHDWVCEHVDAGDALFHAAFGRDEVDACDGRHTMDEPCPPRDKLFTSVVHECCEQVQQVRTLLESYGVLPGESIAAKQGELINQIRQIVDLPNRPHFGTSDAQLH